MKSSETDITFLNKLNARDHEAFKQLFREFFQDIAYYSSKILKDTDIAEDIAQEVFIRLWEKENHFENYLALKSYLYLSARNCCLNYIKHHNIVVWNMPKILFKKKPTSKLGTRLSRVKLSAYYQTTSAIFRENAPKSWNL